MADLWLTRDWRSGSSPSAERCRRLTARSRSGHAAELRINWDKGMEGGKRRKGDDFASAQRAFLAGCTVCGGPDSADHWIRRCPHEAMMQYRADCVTNINNYIRQVKIELVARVLRNVLKLAVEHTEGYRIWTANWPASCQDELDLYIQDSCRKVTPATLRTHLVAVQEHFITALRQMWALKSLLPLHTQIASRLEGDMSCIICTFVYSHWRYHATHKSQPSY